MNQYLTQRKEIFTLLNQMFNWDTKRCKAWFATPNAHLDNFTPCQMVMNKQGTKLIQWIKGCRGY